MRLAIVAGGAKNAARDLRGGQAAGRAQGERGLRGRRQRGMAAQEQRRGRVGFTAAAGAVGAPCAGQRAAGHGQQPRPWPLWHSPARPLQRRREQRLLHGILTGINLPVPADQRGEDLRRALAQHVLDPVRAGHRAAARTGHGCAECPLIRRTSTGHPVYPTTWAAISSARSSSASTTQ